MIMQRRECLVVVDMQNDFIDGALGTAEAKRIVERVKRRIEAAKEKGQDVVFTRDSHDEKYSETQEGRNLPVEHCRKGTFGWEIVDGLRMDELVFDKPSFGSTELGEYVRNKNMREWS